MTTLELERPILGVGPCGPSSVEMMVRSGEEAQKRGLAVVRISCWKPRSEPGCWDGIGTEKGIKGIVEVARRGLIPASEVPDAQTAQVIVNALDREVTQPRVLLWLGSRNQNHKIQSEVAKVVAEHEWAMLMVKNQPWREKRHWLGIVGHVLHAGLPAERLIICHRGFHPGFDPEERDPNDLRNIPDYQMALSLKVKLSEQTGIDIPMLLDPSHIGGTVANVIRVAREGLSYRYQGTKFDGLFIEVHPKEKVPLTDVKQQLTWEQLDELILQLKMGRVW